MLYNSQLNTTLIIDGNTYLYQSFFAYPLLKNKKGEHCGAIYGFLNKIKSLLLKINPKKIIIVFDSPLLNFRHKLFKAYKINRPSMPNLLKLQITPLKKIINAMGIPIITIPYIEGDDIIGTLSKIGESKKETILLCSNDKDMEQLINKNVSIINNKMENIGLKEIKKKYGILPQYLTHLMALMGDHSDNIPGVYGIGKITAIALIKKFSTIYRIYENLEEVKNTKIRGIQNTINKLKNNKENAFLSLKLATIKTNIKIEIEWEKIIFNEPNIEILFNMFQKYEFKKWMCDLKKNFWLKQYTKKK
ncbi:DNA polymerase I [Buchnera aphidicola (Thelaxes suberi)]|uniref:5'-3' exonuclease n=1 Tax=Buchnera aphidicola TaxID=9 RepID=UPI003464A95E